MWVIAYAWVLAEHGPKSKHTPWIRQRWLIYRSNTFSISLTKDENKLEIYVFWVFTKLFILIMWVLLFYINLDALYKNLLKY